MLDSNSVTSSGDEHIAFPITNSQLGSISLEVQYTALCPTKLHQPNSPSGK